MRRICVFLLVTALLVSVNLTLYSSAEAKKEESVYPIDRAVGGTVEASGQSPENEGKEHAFDKLLKTKWLIFESSGWIQYTFPNDAAYKITSYTISAANDFPERDPKNWTLKASNNGKDWVTLDTRQNENFDWRYQTKTYSFSNKTAFKTYRLELSNHSGSILQLSQIKLFDAKPAPKPVGARITASGENAPNETKENLNDGSSLTKWLTFQKSGWVTYQFDSPIAIDGYAFTSANDFSQRDPADWSLEASNDGKKWVKLDTRKGEKFRYRYQRNYYTVHSKTKYKYYKFAMTANGGNELQLSQIEFTPKNSPLKSILPEIEIRNLDAGGNGKLFDQAMPKAKDDVRAIILKICEILYSHPSQMDVGPKKLIISIEDKPGVAWAGGTPQEGHITITSQHLRNYQNSGQPLRQEILGILYHELTHIYQLDDNRYGEIGYLIEGMADAIRFKVGYHDRTAVTKGGTWKDGYGTTGHFLVWIDEHKHNGFLKELNRSLSPFDGVTWTEDMFKKITGSDVNTLWKEYQKSLP